MGVNRKAGKVLVLAMAYGVGPDKIANQIGCTVNQAKSLLNDFEAKFVAVNKYMADYDKSKELETSFAAYLEIMMLEQITSQQQKQKNN